MAQDLIGDAKVYISRLFESDFSGHDAAHTLRVYKTALFLADREKGCDREAVALAALLHDADDTKLFSTENYVNARSFLACHGVPEERIAFILSIIASVSFRENRGKAPRSPEGRIVQDADRLDALGAIGIARTFAYGGAHGRSLDDSVAHFYEKLLLLKDELNTDAARSLAQSRHAFLEAFLEEYRKETQ